MYFESLQLTGNKIFISLFSHTFFKHADSKTSLSGSELVIYLARHGVVK